MRSRRFVYDGADLPSNHKSKVTDTSAVSPSLYTES